MLVGVLSDTHDNMVMIGRALAIFRERGAEVILHAGDFVAPFAMRLLTSAGLPVIGVFGNNDGERRGLSLVCDGIHEPPYRLELGGRVIVLTHDRGPMPAETLDGADVLIHGHSHRPEIEPGPPLILNPGEAGGWLRGRCTAAMLDLTSLEVQLIELGEQETFMP